MEIITHPGSGIENVEDLKGKNLAFTSQTSNSGFGGTFCHFGPLGIPST
ncbi:PhnD/SsuA/transferrin family substrate-binding protein [Vibrio chagasii]|nr:PhnD/SsuA/transferrin family substrate-binding protein [Vibrio chagasii]